MLTKELMTKDVITVKPETSVSEVAEILHSKKLSGLPVVNSEGTVVGLITEKQLFSSDSKLYLPGYIQILKETHFVIGGHKELPYVAGQLTRTKAADIMNQDVYFGNPDMPVEELAENFGKYDQNPIPITDSANKLQGIVSRSDLVKLLLPPNPIHPGNHEITHSHDRPIDQELLYVHKDLSSRFAYVARARANVWLTTAVVLFIVGFVLGVVYVADPTILSRPNNTMSTYPAP